MARTRYTSASGGLTNAQLSYGTWYVRHREQIRRALVFLFGVVAVGLCVYGIGGLGYYLAFGSLADNELAARQLAEIENYDRVNVMVAPRALAVRDVRTFLSGTSKYDVVGFIENPNQWWYAVVTVLARMPDGSEYTDMVTVLPGGRVPAGVFGIPASSFPSGAQLVLQDIDWQRVSRRRVPRLDSYVGFRLNVSLMDLTLDPTSPTKQFPTVSFSLRNATAFGYRSLPVIIALDDGQTVTRFIKTTLDTFRAGETRAQVFTLFGDQPTVLGASVYPSIDVFDEEVFLRPGE